MIHVPVERQYLKLVSRVLETGSTMPNRTGIDTLKVHGAYLTADLGAGAPVLTTKRVAWKSAYAEMIGFLRGLDNAADFRKLGCQVWDANANENAEWLSNPHRKGPDDLGPVYGSSMAPMGYSRTAGSHLDQLRERLIDSRTVALLGARSSRRGTPASFT